MRHLFWLTILGIALVAGSASAQGPILKPSDVVRFMGTWRLNMTIPAGAHETIRVWDEQGVIKASAQAEQFPPIAATGIMKDGDVLILTMTRFENGKPDRSVISLTIDGDTMSIAQMLEFSPNIKRGSGRKE